MSEKINVATVAIAEEGLNTSSDGPLDMFDRVAERKLVGKLDLRIIPICFVLFLCAFIDRSVWRRRWNDTRLT